MKEFDFHSPRQKNLIPVNDPDRYLEIIRLEHALKVSWGEDTVAEWERSEWSADLPAFGQCAVTSLVVQDFFGGTIVKDPDNDHYWNKLDDGTEVDLSRQQFAEGITLTAQLGRERDYMLTHERSVAAKTPDRYHILRSRVRQVMGE